MDNDLPVRARRGLVVGSGVLLGFSTGTALLAWGTGAAVAAAHAPGPVTADALVVLAAAAGAWALLSWLTGVTLMALAAAAWSGVGSRGHAAALALTPAIARRAVATLVGVVIAGAPLSAVVPAGATESPDVVVTAPAAPAPDDTAPTRGPGPTIDALDRPVATAPAGWTPDRPAAARRHHRPNTAAVRLVASIPNAEHGVADEVVVRRGDSLWDIAARHLGHDAGAVEVAAEWPRWYAANRSVVGADPNLLLPGQRLVAPGP